MFYLIILLQYLVVSDAATTKNFHGYATGYLSDCPGSDKPAVISADSLRYLRFTVLGFGNFITASQTEYNYYQMQELAQNTDFKQKIVMYMSGYLDSPRFFTPGIMGTVYKRTGNFTVWMLDYNKFSTFPYPIAARFLRTVGKHVGEMLAELTKYGFDPDKFELVGLSHGGQGISYIAKNYKRLTGKPLSKIVSLEPAGPCFRNLSPAERLNKSDAKFVLVVHTNVDGFGIAEPCGHVDFYVNGAEFQLSDGSALIPCTSLCSHAKAYMLWIAALEHPKSFIGMQCDSVEDARLKNCYARKPRVTNVLGPRTNPNKTGIFFLNIGPDFPYYMGKEGLQKKKETYSYLMAQYNLPDVMVE